MISETDNGVASSLRLDRDRATGATLQRGAWMRPIRPDDLAPLEALAGADAHAVIAPSHVFLKDGEIVGYASIAQVPLLLPYFHTEKCDARDSKDFIRQMENLLANTLPQGHDGMICVPVVKTSPFEPNIERLGYSRAKDEIVLTFKFVR